MKPDFDIDVLKNVSANERRHAELMFHRRHIYTHYAGIADQKYIDDSGDTTIAPGQLIRETRENAFELTPTLVKMARNLHAGFHAIFRSEEHTSELQSLM